MIYQYDFKSFSKKIVEMISENNELFDLVNFYNENIKEITEKDIYEFIRDLLIESMGKYVYLEFKDLYEIVKRKKLNSRLATKKRWSKQDKYYKEQYKLIQQINSLITESNNYEKLISLKIINSNVTKEILSNSYEEYLHKQQINVMRWANNCYSTLCDFPLFLYLPEDSKIHAFSIDMILQILKILKKESSNTTESEIMTPIIIEKPSEIDYYYIDTFSILSTLNQESFLDYIDRIIVQYIIEIASSFYFKHKKVQHQITLEIEELCELLYNNVDEISLEKLISRFLRIGNLRIQYKNLNDILGYKYENSDLKNFNIFNVYSYSSSDKVIVITLTEIFRRSLFTTKKQHIIKEEQKRLINITAKAIYEDLYFQRLYAEENSIYLGHININGYKMNFYKNQQSEFLSNLNNALKEYVDKQIIIKNYTLTRKKCQIEFLT